MPIRISMYRLTESSDFVGVLDDDPNFVLFVNNKPNFMHQFYVVPISYMFFGNMKVTPLMWVLVSLSGDMTTCKTKTYQPEFYGLSDVKLSVSILTQIEKYIGEIRC